MQKKQIVTDRNIERDIADAIKDPAELSKSTSLKMGIPVIFLAVFLVVMIFVCPAVVVFTLIALIPFPLVSVAIRTYWIKHRIKNISISDYSMTEETVHSIEEEHYRASNGRKFTSREVVNYTVRFESGKSWRIPKEIYRWSERLRMHDAGIFNSTHRGDTLMVVSRKKDGGIVVAYNTEIFEYKN